MEIDLSILCPNCADNDCVVHTIVYSATEIEVGEIFPCESCGHYLEQDEIVNHAVDSYMSRLHG